MRGNVKKIIALALVIIGAVCIITATFICKGVITALMAIICSMILIALVMALLFDIF